MGEFCRPSEVWLARGLYSPGQPQVHPETAVPTPRAGLGEQSKPRANHRSIRRPRWGLYSRRSLSSFSHRKCRPRNWPSQNGFRTESSTFPSPKTTIASIPKIKTASRHVGFSFRSGGRNRPSIFALQFPRNGARCKSGENSEEGRPTRRRSKTSSANTPPHMAQAAPRRIEELTGAHARPRACVSPGPRRWG